MFDTSGAGDTALAALGLALGAGEALPAAVELALIAASVAVEKAGTATAGPDEILEAELAAHRAPIEAKIVTVAGMAREAERWRRRGLRVGFTNGCFDILHPGHIAYLAQARAWCDRLIVGVNSDASVRGLKGARTTRQQPRGARARSCRPFVCRPGNGVRRRDAQGSD